MKDKRILNLLNIASWIIFIGLCIKTGALLISFFVSLFVNPQASENLYLGLDLSHLYNFKLSHYIVIMTFVILISMLKAYLFYVVIEVFKVIDFYNPFDSSVARLVSRIGKYALLAGIVALIANGYSLWLINQSVFLPLNWGTSELLFMAGVIFIISFFFKRATHIQTENKLTI